jgi:hypothetical protein
MDQFGAHIAATVVFACRRGAAQSTEKARKAKTRMPGTFQVQVSGGQVSLESNDAQLAQIFEEIVSDRRPSRIGRPSHSSWLDLPALISLKSGVALNPHPLYL